MSSVSYPGGLKSSRHLLTSFAAICIITVTASGDAQMLANRPFLNSIDGSLSASFSGPRCGDEVSFTFVGPQAATFNKDGVATRLMNNVVATLRTSCSRVKLVAAKGTVNGQIVYNAVAESGGGWELLELGSSRDASMLGGGARGTSGDRVNFAKRRDFAAFGEVLTAMKGKPNLCGAPQGSSCTSISQFKNASEDGATVIARSLLDSRGTQAVLTYAALNRSGFLCSNPEQAKIDVVGGGATPAARARMAVDLRERLKPYGKQVCSGYALRGNQFTSANFDENGARMGQEALLTPTATNPTLRQDR